MGWYHWEQGTLHLRLRVQPRARRDELVGPHGDRFKVRITAPPVAGKANTHLLVFLARLFQVPRSRVRLVGGAANRDKDIAIDRPDLMPPAMFGTGAAGPPPASVP